MDKTSLPIPIKVKQIIKENFKTKTEAIKRERFSKSGQGRKWLDDNNIK